MRIKERVGNSLCWYGDVDPHSGLAGVYRVERPMKVRRFTANRQSAALVGGVAQWLAGFVARS